MRVAERNLLDMLDYIQADLLNVVAYHGGVHRLRPRVFLYTVESRVLVLVWNFLAGHFVNVGLLDHHAYLRRPTDFYELFRLGRGSYRPGRPLV